MTENSLEKPTTDKSVVVIFHKNCWDGTGAAWAAWKKLGDAAEYFPFNYSNNIDELIDIAGKEVYVVDFSFKRDVLEGLRSVAKSVTVIDHHKTAEEELRGLDNCVFDMGKSGAVLTWEYFHPGIDTPQILNHIQDRDLWKFELPETVDLHAYLTTRKHSIQVIDDVHCGVVEFDAAVAAGRAVNEFKHQTIEMMFKNAKLVTILGKKVMIANCVPNIASEMGNKLAVASPDGIGISYSFSKDGHVTLSIRGHGDGVDTTPIAKHFGGGGHALASGGKTDLLTLNEWYSQS